MNKKNPEQKFRITDALREENVSNFRRSIDAYVPRKITLETKIIGGGLVLIITALTIGSVYAVLQPNWKQQGGDQLICTKSLFTEEAYKDCVEGRNKSRQKEILMSPLVDLQSWIIKSAIKSAKKAAKDTKTWINSANDKQACFMPSHLKDKDQKKLSYGECVEEKGLIRRYGKKLGKPMALGKRKVEGYSDQAQELLDKASKKTDEFTNDISDLKKKALKRGNKMLEEGSSKIKSLTDQTTQKFNNLMNEWGFVKKDKEKDLVSPNKSSII